MTIKENIPNRFLTKSKFGYKNKAHDFEDATFEWVLKRDKKALGPITVSVWDEHGKPHNPDLRLEFPPSKIGMEEARSYTKQVLEAGAILADIVVVAYFPYGEYERSIESTTFENTDKI